MAVGKLFQKNAFWICSDNILCRITLHIYRTRTIIDHQTFHDQVFKMFNVINSSWYVCVFIEGPVTVGFTAVDWVAPKLGQTYLTLDCGEAA